MLITILQSSLEISPIEEAVESLNEIPYREIAN